MRAAVISPFAISSSPTFTFAAISDGSSAGAGGREGGDVTTDRGPVANGEGRCTASTEVTSSAAPRAPTGATPIAAAGPDRRSESRFETLRFAAGLAIVGTTLAWPV